MEHIVITWNTVLSFFGAVAIIGGGIKVLAQLLNPFKELKEHLKKHDEMLHNDNERIKEQDKALARIEEGQKIQGRAMMEILNHMITGNDTDKLKERYQEMVDFYIEK